MNRPKFHLYLMLTLYEKKIKFKNITNVGRILLLQGEGPWPYKLVCLVRLNIKRQLGVSEVL